MEVCHKCLKEIKPNDKYIIGDPNKLTKITSASFQHGINNRRTPNAKLQNHKYHLECYNQARKKSIINTFILLFILIIICAIIFTIIYFTVIK